ncbi:MAG: flagellar hook-length control protein FliK [Actinomycetaceae bacterium]|nr:flagellar hook-length control protein FliK [Actinomycetaceae bacterium]
MAAIDSALPNLGNQLASNGNGAQNQGVNPASNSAFASIMSLVSGSGRNTQAPTVGAQHSAKAREAAAFQRATLADVAPRPASFTPAQRPEPSQGPRPATPPAKRYEGARTTENTRPDKTQVSSNTPQSSQANQSQAQTKPAEGETPSTVAPKAESGTPVQGNTPVTTEDTQVALVALVDTLAEPEEQAPVAAQDTELEALPDEIPVEVDESALPTAKAWDQDVQENPADVKVVHTQTQDVHTQQAPASTDSAPESVAAPAPQAPPPAPMHNAQQDTAPVVAVAGVPATAAPAPATSSPIAPASIGPVASAQAPQAAQANMPGASPIVATAPAAPTAPAQAATPLSYAPANLPAQVVSQLQHHVGRLQPLGTGEHQLRLAITPETFGTVRVNATFGADGFVRIHLMGADASAQEQLRQALSDLRRDLASTGIRADLNLAEDARTFAGQQGLGRGGDQDNDEGARGAGSSQEDSNAQDAQGDEAGSAGIPTVGTVLKDGADGSVDMFA